jgi:hypothetical protein
MNVDSLGVIWLIRLFGLANGAAIASNQSESDFVLERFFGLLRFPISDNDLKMVITISGTDGTMAQKAISKHEIGVDRAFALLKHDCRFYCGD